MKILLIILSSFLFIAPAFTQNSTSKKANKIIKKAIKKHGGKKYNNLLVEFDFRKKHYISKRDGAGFSYEKIYQDKEGKTIHDVLTNKNFQRKINNEAIELSEKDQGRFSRSVNSVIYFALLPYFLNDPAVQKKYVGTSTIKGQPYYKIKVTFRKDGGGKDFDDEYMYWIHQKNYTMDYLAYNFHVNGGGARFREAINIRTINGIRFADYINYKPKKDNRNVEEFDQIFEQGGMKELSRILSENIQVK